MRFVAFAVLRLTGQAIGLMKKGALKTLFQAFKKRRGHNWAVVAIAHRLVLIIYALFAKGKSYEDKPTEALEKVRVARFVNSVRNIKKLNYVILKDGKELVNKETDVITTVPL